MARDCYEEQTANIPGGQNPRFFPRVLYMALSFAGRFFGDENNIILVMNYDRLVVSKIVI